MGRGSARARRRSPGSSRVSHHHSARTRALVCDFSGRSSFPCLPLAFWSASLCSRCASGSCSLVLQVRIFLLCERLGSMYVCVASCITRCGKCDRSSHESPSENMFYSASGSGWVGTRSVRWSVGLQSSSSSKAAAAKQQQQSSSSKAVAATAKKQQQQQSSNSSKAAAQRNPRSMVFQEVSR